MEEEQRKEPITDIQHPDYDPANDPEVEDSFPKWMNNLRDKLDPYQRPVMIIGFIILVMLVVFLGYARGALDVCNDLGGRLEASLNFYKIKCHPGQGIPIENVDMVGQPFIVPDFIQNES